MADRRDGLQPPPLPPSAFQGTSMAINGVNRLLAAGLGCFGALVFLLGAALYPYAEDGAPLTHGPHRQLGLPPCHFQSLLGLPCPSCGMTTSVSLCMHGDFAAAMRVNWAGVVVTVLGVLTTGCLILTAISGCSPLGLSPDRAVQWLAISGAAAAVFRYLGVAAASLLA